MSEQKKNEKALKQLGIEIPKGWDFVRYGQAEKGEWTIDRDGYIMESITHLLYDRFIVKKKIETDCWYLVEDKEGNSQCMWLNIHNEWQVYKSEDAPTWRFDKFEIISKMVVEK